MGRTPEKNVQLGGVDPRGPASCEIPLAVLAAPAPTACGCQEDRDVRQKETENEGPKEKKEVGRKGG